MFIKCTDSSNVDQRFEALSEGRVYEIDERRDLETSLAGERYYFVNGKRYGGWRFQVVTKGARQ